MGFRASSQETHSKRRLTQPARGGAGLGLSIVSAVTEAHGGTAEVRPTAGGGATFVIALPLATA